MTVAPALFDIFDIFDFSGVTDCANKKRGCMLRVMNRRMNPFKPTVGGEPPLLIGRERVIRDFDKGLDDGVGAPGRIMLITGARGTGKTVMLTVLGDKARAYKWDVIEETAPMVFASVW